MTVRTRKNWIKYVLVAILIIVLAIGGVMIWKSFQTPEENSGRETMPAQSTIPKNDDTNVKKDENETNEKKVEKKVEQFDGEDPNEKAELTGVITYAGVNDGSLMIRVNIDQYLAGGMCKLKIIGSSGVAYEETVEVADSAATATCKGFNVATTKLPSEKVNISILVTSGNKTGTIKGEVSL